jgi:putative oxidoreductase
MTTTTDRPTAPTREAGPAAEARLADRSLGLLVVRVIVGLVFVGHGAQKLFGAFHGGGIDGTATFFESAGYSPGRPIAVLAGLIEFGGGLLLIAGLGASFAAAAIAADMAGATAVVHAQGHGAFFAQGGGYEYELLLALVAFGLTLTGAGRLALDDGRAWDRPLVRRTLAALAVVGAAVALALR